MSISLLNMMLYNSTWTWLLSLFFNSQGRSFSKGRPTTTTKVTHWISVNKMQMLGLLHSSQILCWKYKEILSHLSKQQIIPQHYSEHRALQQSFVKSKEEVNYTICTVVECKYGYRQSLLRIFDNIVSLPDKGNSPYVYSLLLLARSLNLMLGTQVH